MLKEQIRITMDKDAKPEEIKEIIELIKLAYKSSKIIVKITQ